MIIIVYWAQSPSLIIKASTLGFCGLAVLGLRVLGSGSRPFGALVLGLPGCRRRA